MWEVQIKGDLESKRSMYEISVIKSDNWFGKMSWGWGSVNKIILFASGGIHNQINLEEKKDVEFAKDVAQKLADALNGK